VAKLNGEGARPTLDQLQDERELVERGTRAERRRPDARDRFRGGETFAKALDIARPGARVVTYGGRPAMQDPAVFDLLETARVLGHLDGQPVISARCSSSLPMDLEPAIDEVVALADVPAAAQRTSRANISVRSSCAFRTNALARSRPAAAARPEAEFGAHDRGVRSLTITLKSDRAARVPPA